MFETMLMQKAASLLLGVTALSGLPSCGITSAESGNTQQLCYGEDGNRIYSVA